MVDEDGTLRFQNRLYVPDKAELNEKILLRHTTLDIQYILGEQKCIEIWSNTFSGITWKEKLQSM